MHKAVSQGSTSVPLGRSCASQCGTNSTSFEHDADADLSNSLSNIGSCVSLVTTKVTHGAVSRSLSTCWPKRKGPFLLGVAGGTASGKTSVARNVEKELLRLWGEGTVASFSQDCFYKNLTAEEMVDAPNYNWDHPDAFDWEENIKVVQSLQGGGDVCVPAYDYANNCRFGLEKAQRISGQPPLRVVIVDGILLFHNQALRHLFDLTLFVDVDDDERLCRRLQRDVAERGRDVEGVLKQYENTVKPSYEAFCAPTRGFADIVVPGGAENRKGVQVIIDVVKNNAAPRK